MTMSGDQKKKFVAIARRLKDQKGITVKQSEILQDITKVKQAQQDILIIKNNHKDIDVVQKEADKEIKKLQEVINELNEYMSILHPEGLIDFGTGKGGKQVVSQG